MDLLRPCMLFNNEPINKVWLKTQYRAETSCKKGEATMKGRKFILKKFFPEKNSWKYSFFVNTFGLPAILQRYFKQTMQSDVEKNVRMRCQENFTTPFRMLKNSLSGRPDILRILANQGLMEELMSIHNFIVVDQLVFNEVVAMICCIFLVNWYTPMNVMLISCCCHFVAINSFMPAY